MHFNRTLLMGLVLLLAVFTGCSNNDTTSPSNLNTATQPGVFDGEIGDADFEITLRTAVGEDHPLQGPFVLRGYNIHYDGDLGATVCDLTVTNKGEVPHSDPVGITFITLLPNGVEVLNPDNGENGNGAAIMFEFANDDGMWTPGEESLPRETQFKAASNVAIGFVARLDISTEPPGGSIGGVVWNDANENGEMDPGEGGIGGVTIWLEMTMDPPDTMRTAMLAAEETHTADDGSYRFDGLVAGFYTVGKMPSPDYLPTTPSSLFVILVEDTSGVSSFLTADFGCIPGDTIIPPDPEEPVLSVGDYVSVNGKWDGDYLVAWGIDHFECDGDSIVEPPDTIIDPRLLSMNDGDDGDDWDDWDDHNRGDCRDWDHWVCMLEHGKIRGPVTALDTVSSDTTGVTVNVEIMGTSVHVMLMRDHSSKALTLDDIKVGDRVEARIKYTDDGWVAWRLREWRGQKEQVHGFIEEVMEGDMHKIRVFDTWVVVKDDMCYDHECDRDDRGDH